MSRRAEVGCSAEAVAALPSFAARQSSEIDFYASREWYECLNEAAAVDRTGEVLFLVADREAAPSAFLPLLLLPRSRRYFFARAAVSRTLSYSTWYGPTMAGTTDDIQGVAQALGQTLGMQAPADVVHLDCLDGDSAVPSALAEGLADADYAVTMYDHFENWYERIEEGFDAYWQARSSQLRNTVRRKHNRLQRTGEVVFELLSDPGEAERALAAYQSVYSDSWKETEPHPGFIPALIRRGIAAGAVYVGLLSLDGEVIAAQIWVVSNRRATIFKLAYRDHAKSHSPGSLLTWWTFKTLCERIGLSEVDFGRGGDAFKRDWLPRMRLRKGLIACRPRSPGGLAAAARHIWLPNLLRRVRGPDA